MSTPTSKTMAERIAERVVLEVCELPDYNSPEGQPDLVMCTVQELNACVLRAFEQLEYDREMERGPPAHETREPPRQLELTNELRWILGRPCFMVIPMVQCLRKMGRHIDTKAEDEQAVAIHWMLSLYLEHGADKWRDEAEKILKEGQRQANELKAEGGET